MDKNERLGSDVEMKSPFVSKLENFWYYYKWHTIVALFLVFTILVCSLQMCSMVEVDSYIMYAGGKSISRTLSGGDRAEYARVIDAMKRIVPDFNGDGEKNVSLSTLFQLSPEEIAEIEARNDGTEVNYSLLSTDTKTLRDRMYIGEYYVCLFSPYVYECYREADGVALFVSAADFAPEENELEYYSDCAVKLSSTPFYKNNPAIRDVFPEDTLVCLRIKSAVSSAFGGSENEEIYRRAETVFSNILGGEDN